MALIDGLVAIGVIGGLGWIIYAKMMKNNPALAEKTRELFSGGLYKQDPETDLIVKDKMEQVHEEKRSMM